MGDDDAARKTYRYLRIGMVGAVVLLAASVLIEHRDGPGCWQTSISAYYYTPVRSIFVGVLMAIGLSLIVIKGSTGPEDICLNAAGILAPVVALVPTSDPGTCWSVPPTALPTQDTAEQKKVLADWVVALIHNNIEALLWAGLFGLVVAAGIAIAAGVVGRTRGEQGQARRAWSEDRATILGLVAFGVFLAAGALAFYHRTDDVIAHAHMVSAVTMFAFLAGAAVANYRDSKRHGGHWYPRLYAAVAVLMVLTASLFLTGYEYKVLWIEVLEIVWFMTLWIVQSRELWHHTLRGSE